MFNYLQSIVACFCFVFFSCLVTHAQVDLQKKSPEDAAEQAFNDLKNGTLVVRLPSNHNKITRMQQVIDRPETSESGRKRLQEQLRETVDETRIWNRLLMKAFQQEFDFAEVRFFYDTATVWLVGGARAGIFLNENLEVDETIAIPTNDWLGLRVGKTDPAETVRQDALIFTDRNFADLMRLLMNFAANQARYMAA